MLASRNRAQRGERGDRLRATVFGGIGLLVVIFITNVPIRGMVSVVAVISRKGTRIDRYLVILDRLLPGQVRIQIIERVP